MRSIFPVLKLVSRFFYVPIHTNTYTHTRAKVALVSFFHFSHFPFFLERCFSGWIAFHLHFHVCVCSSRHALTHTCIRTKETGRAFPSLPSPPGRGRRMSHLHTFRFPSCPIAHRSRLFFSCSINLENARWCCCARFTIFPHQHTHTDTGTRFTHLLSFLSVKKEHNTSLSRSLFFFMQSSQAKREK